MSVTSAPLPSSGPLDLASVGSNLLHITGGAAISTSELYGCAAGVPISGPLSFSTFYGLQNTKPTNTSNAYISASYGAAPWNTTNSFPDTSASWIWYTSNSTVSAPTYTGHLFQRTLYSSNNTPTSGVLYFAADDYVNAYFNKALVGHATTWTSTCNCSVTIQPGSNLLELGASNSTGSAGLIYSLQVGGSFMVHSDTNTLI